MARRSGRQATKRSPQTTRWLNDEEEAAWRAFATTMVKLRWARMLARIDGQQAGNSAAT